MGSEKEESLLSMAAAIVSSREAWMTTRSATAGVDMRGRGGDWGVEQRRQEKEEDRRRATR